jgi:hypothetical protein
MEHEEPLARRVGIYVDQAVWHAFRIACVTRKTSSSKELERLMREQLDAWATAPMKETDHV